MDRVELDPNKRAIINADFGVTNVVTLDEVQDRITGALDRCANILTDHCGPQSGYAMLVDNGSSATSFKPNVFTRDGIRILTSTEFVSPLERYIKDLLTYIGTRVDSSAKDGTTTSMLFTAIFLKRLLQDKQKLTDNGLSFFQISTAIDSIFNELLTEIDKYTCTIEKLSGKNVSLDDLDPEELQKLAGKVAFMQAISSSGGNLELAYHMQTIFERSPRISWEFISSHTSAKENGKPISVEIDPYDTHIRCASATEGILNRALGTEYMEEDVRVLVCIEAMANNGINYDRLMSYLKDYPADKPLCIMAKQFSSSIISEINAINTNPEYGRKAPISTWLYAPEKSVASQAWPWELLTLAAIAGAEPFDFGPKLAPISDELNTFSAPKLHWHDGYLDFYDIVKTDGKSCLHPFYSHPETATPFYRDVLEQVVNQLDMYKNGHLTDGLTQGLFVEILNKLACIHRPTLRLGGPAHEQIANKDVIQDVQGATMSALNHGFLTNGPVALYVAADTLYRRLGDELNSYTEDPNADVTASAICSTKHIIAENFRESIGKVCFTLNPDICGSVDETNAINPNNVREYYCDIIRDTGYKSYTNVMDGVKYEHNKISDLGEYLTFLENYPTYESAQEDGYVMNRLATCYPVAHPVAITKELLKRNQELIMKFIFANKIIVYGGVMVDKKDKEEK